MTFYDIERENLAFVVVANVALRQQSKKRKVGVGQLNILLAIHLLEAYPGGGVYTSELTDTRTGSTSLLRTNIHQLEATGYVTRYQRYSRASRRICITQKGENLIMHLPSGIATDCQQIAGIVRLLSPRAIREQTATTCIEAHLLVGENETHRAGWGRYVAEDFLLTTQRNLKKPALGKWIRCYSEK